jgi:ribosomal protein L12E/L44/L45/RPP1/RPP2
MPTDAAYDIVNALFAGQKDLSDYVDTAMKAVAVDAIDAKKKELGAKMFSDAEPESEEETEEPEEETTDETDQRGD